MDQLSFWYAVTLLGTPEYWGFAALGLAATYLALRYLVPEKHAWKKHKPTFKRFLTIFLPSIAILFVLILGIKTAVYIPRPCTTCPDAFNDGLAQLNQAVGPGVCNPYCDVDSSFPSGHAGTAFVAFSSLYLVYRRRLAIQLFIIPALIAYSRVALGVHTWVDVLGGAFLGLIVPFMVSVMARKWYKLK